MQELNWNLPCFTACRFRGHLEVAESGMRSEGAHNSLRWVAVGDARIQQRNPGVFKNAIDWLSRPPAEIPKLFGNCPVALIGATPGGFGTVMAQAQWLPVLRTLGTHPWFGGRLMVSAAHKVFNENGELVDEVVRTQLRNFLHGFGRFVQVNAAPPG